MNEREATIALQTNDARALVADMCDFTATNKPDQAARAQALKVAFCAFATDDWAARTGNGNMLPKDWIRAAMRDGFQMPV